MHTLLTTSVAALALSAASPATAAHTSDSTAWTVVRVDVSQRGDLEGMRVAYHSGDLAFDRAALAIVAKTNFTPTRQQRGSATIDYVVARDDSGGRHARVLPAVGAARTVAWTAN